MAHPSAGASLEVRRSEPSVDLATLIEWVADAVPVPKAGAGALLSRQRRPLFTWRPSAPGSVLSADTRTVISRLTTTKAFSRLKPGGDTGFLRDAPVPRRQTSGHLGGVIVEATGGQLRKGVARLVNLIDSELLESGVPRSALTLLASDTPERVLREIGARSIAMWRTDS